MSMSLDEYLNYDMQKAMETYWTERTKEDAAGQGDPLGFK
jgi:hypothetical protein